MYQILTIARRDLYTTFTDRNLILIMIATPLLLSTIIGLAFGGGGARQINLAIVNHDQPTELGGEEFNYGDQLVTVFRSIGGEDVDIAVNDEFQDNTCPLSNDEKSAGNTPQGALFDLDMRVTEYDSVDLAREAVEKGEHAAVLIIPENFSQMMSAGQAFSLDNILGVGSSSDEPAELELYANSGSTISAGIVKSILEGVTNRMSAGNIVIQSTIENLIANPQLLREMQGADIDEFSAFACAFDGTITSIHLDNQPLDTVQEASAFVQIVVSIGSAQAAFFAMFTAVQSILYIYEEKKQGTFDRLTVAPIPRWYLLAGNLVGTIATVIFQLLLLMVGLTAVASLVEGELVIIWGTNFLHLILVVIALSLSVSGVGIFIAGIAKDSQQAQIVSPIVNILVAFLGGAFGIQLPQSLRQFSLIYWGSEAFDKLARGNTYVGINIIVLMLLGVVLFSIGTWLFSRRIEI